MSEEAPRSVWKSPAYIWLLYLMLASAAAVAYLFLPKVLQNVTYSLIGVSMLAAIVLGISWHRPAPAWPWYLIAFGLSLFGAGDMVFLVIYENVLGVLAPFPSVADALYLGSYTITAVGLAFLVRPATGSDWGNLLDVGIITIGAGLTLWKFLMEPYVKDQSIPLFSTLISIAYPLMALLWFALALRIVFVSASRPPSFYLLLGGIALHPVADTVYGVLTLQDAYQSGTVLDLGWLLSYALFGATALHPSMREMSAREYSYRTRVPWWRLALLTVAALMAPVIFWIHTAQGDEVHAPLIGGAFVLLSLVMFRIVLLLRNNERVMEEVSQLNGTLEQRVEERTAELERILAELKENEERTSLVLDASTDGIFKWDIRTGEIYWNDRLFELLGLSPEEDTPSVELLAELLHPEDRPRVMQRKSSIIEQGGEYNEEYRIRHSSGEYLTCITRAKVRRDEDGTPVRMAGSVVDITKRRRIEEEQTRLASIVENSNDAIDSKTLDGIIVSLNPGAEKLYGYTAEELKGKHISVLTPPELADEVKEVLERVGQGQTIDEYETIRISKDSRRIPLSLTVSPVRDSKGTIIGASAIARDITERKRYERELKEARQAADEANRAKSEFVANMSHEIRTPMNGVIGMTGLLMDTDLDEEQRAFAEIIRASGENLLNIINDILDFSKIEAGRLDLETIDFDLRSTVEEIFRLFAERAHEKGLELVNLIDYDVPDALKGDPGRLSQILINLIGNAIKFTEEGEVLLKVSLIEEQSDAASIRFEVTDTGIGLTEEQQSRLFQPFSQVDGSTTRLYGGTGLGLAISRQLVEMMGGEIGLESEPGKGSTFWFSVPFEKQPEETQLTPRSRYDLEGLRVLVVDDNATSRKVISQQVLSWEMNNGMAADGRQALEVLREAAESGESYDVAILDSQMPGMDGVELAREIKADPTISQTRLILLSSVPERGEAREARKAGILSYLPKPVMQSQIYDALATVMDTAESEQQEARLITRHTLREQRARSRTRILLAEDNAVNQKVAVRMLEKLGYRADVAANGLEVVEALSHISYSAVLMDVHMPEMDGYEATQEIRRREEGTSRHIPIIALTASAMKGDRESS